MRSARQLHLTGAIIRLSGITGVLASSIAAPYLLGATVYGFCSAAIAIPLSLQGLMEPGLNSIMIAHMRTRVGRAKIALTMRVMACLVVLGAVAIWFHLHNFIANAQTPDFFVFALLITFLILFLLNTLLTGLAYALNSHHAIILGYTIPGVVFLVSVCLLSRFDARGFFLATVAWQLTTTSLYFSNSRIRRSLALLARVQPAPMLTGFATEIVPAISSRIALVSLNTFSVVWLAAVSTPDATASFKVTLAMIGLLRFAIPISPEIIQSLLEQSEKNPHRSTFQAIWLACGLAFFASGVLAFFADSVRARLLNTLDEPEMLDYLFFAAPFLFCIAPLSSVLFAFRMKVTLAVSAMLCVVVQFLFSYLFGVAQGVIAGSIVFVVAALPGLICIRASDMPSNLGPDSCR